MKPGIMHRVDGLVELPLVLGEVGDDLGAHVERHQRHIVLGTKLLREGPGRIAACRR